MLSVGTSVRVLPPFAEAFPETYKIAAVQPAEDSQTVVYLDGIDSAFSPDYLEPA